MSLSGRKVVVGLTGGIACYKVPYLVRYLVKEEADVQVIMTDSATKFITPLTLESVSQAEVAVEMFPAKKFVATHHIDLAEWPELIVIAPATANFLGKVASGISDDLLTTVICATAAPVMIAPAMNPQMWNNPITQKNYETLKSLGYHFVDPGEGEMACDHFGVGRMAEPDEIFERVKEFFGAKKKVLEGKKVIVTAGPTREAIDPVRVITNRSSGKMGYAIAQAAHDLGATTILISGPTALNPPKGVKTYFVESTDDLCNTVSDLFDEADCLIMAAAPADQKPAKAATTKMKKSESAFDLHLVPTVDILKSISGRKKAGQLVVGFALETDNGVAHAQKKLKEKKLDMIVLNETGADTAFEVDTNKVTIIEKSGKTEEWPLESKREIAEKLIARISKKLK